MRCALILCLVFTCSSTGFAAGPSSAAVQLTLDTSEADQALWILQRVADHQEVTLDDWRQLFDTAPYRALQAREAAIGASFTDEEFKKFLLSPEASTKRQEWQQTLADMKRSNMQSLGTAVMAWLPSGAAIHADVFPEIKPLHNSFVWTRPGGGPAIFLYLEPQSQAKFEVGLS